MADFYETTPPKLTLTLLEEKHIKPVYKNLSNGKFLFYLFGREEPLSLEELKFYEGGTVISFDIDGFHELPGSNPDGITDGVLLITNNGGEATAVDVSWVTGVSSPVDAYAAFLNLSPAQQKSYIHPRLFQNIIAVG